MTVPETATDSPDAALRLLQVTARLLVEYNARSKEIERRVARMARHAGVEVQTFVGYREVILATPDGRDFHARAAELRINVAARVATYQVIDEFCLGRIGIEDATRRLEAVERVTPHHNRWLVVALFGLAASAIAWLLRADAGAVLASGVCSAAGLVARQEVAKRPVLVFAPPFAAALVGAMLGGLAIRLGWTQTPGLCLIVPALMLVPGPHLINGLHDMLDNHMASGISRLGLATGILTAAALGVLLGGWLTLSVTALSTASSEALPLTLALDAALAGVAACGFGAFYNAPWRVLWVSILCGTIGHGLRYVCLESMGVAMSTFFACLVIGLIAGAAADRMRMPFASVAFAGAVPMMPGVYLYQSLGGAMRLATAGPAADPAAAATVLALSFSSALVVGAMVLGLLIGARLAGLAQRDRDTVTAFR